MMIFGMLLSIHDTSFGNSACGLIFFIYDLLRSLLTSHLFNNKLHFACRKLYYNLDWPIVKTQICCWAFCGFDVALDKQLKSKSNWTTPKQFMWVSKHQNTMKCINKCINKIRFRWGKEIKSYLCNFLVQCN